ncbi:PH domain-containing protein [Streptacidiphilus monticola]
MSESETQRAATGGAPAVRKYRSIPGVVTGILMLALLLWLTLDAMVYGHGRSLWFALAALVLLGPLIAAFTVWPVVTADQDRIVVRNPLRTIAAPWRSVESVVAALSVELRAEGRKYVIWSIPVSLRQRKRAGRRAMRDTGDRALLSRGSGGPVPAAGAARAASAHPPRDPRSPRRTRPSPS